MPFYRLNFTVAPRDADRAAAIAQLFGTSGIEEIARGRGVRLAAWFGDALTARRAGRRLAAGARARGVSVSTVADEDWNARWRESVRLVRAAPGIWASPAWLRPPLEKNDHWIRIEPRMAFGSGHHETTRLAAQAVSACAGAAPGARVLDAGCGSGILSFVAAASGARFCAGFDIDRVARVNLSENLRDNAARGRVSFFIGPAAALRPGARFDIIVMNMLLTESAPLLPAMSALLAEGGRAVLSGILEAEKHRALSCARAQGWALIRESSESEWWCATFVNARRGGARRRRAAPPFTDARTRQASP